MSENTDIQPPMEPAITKEDTASSSNSITSSPSGSPTPVPFPPYLYLEPLIHEDQSLQLCALHTINNLLQLQKSIDPPASESDNNLEEGLLVGGRLYPSSSSFVPCGSTDIATTRELNQIADELTQREHKLLTQGVEAVEDTFCEDNKKTKISLWRKLKSQHRTVVAGNYSFEVLEAFLKKRNVFLKWFATDAHSIASLDVISSRESEQNDSVEVPSSGINNNSSNIVIGFVLNAAEMKSSYWDTIVHSIFGGERHWFAITRLRRCWIPAKSCTTTNENEQIGCLFLDSETEEEEEYDPDVWHLVDSDFSEVMELTSCDLWDFLKELERDGGTLLQAFVCPDQETEESSSP